LILLPFTIIEGAVVFYNDLDRVMSFLYHLYFVHCAITFFERAEHRSH